MASTAASTTTAAAADKKGLVVVTGARYKRGYNGVVLLNPWVTSAVVCNFLHSSGIGAAIAKAFSDAGHPTLLLARRTGRHAATATKVQSSSVTVGLLDDTYPKQSQWRSLD